MAQNNTPVKALVLAGGGARGSYQVGVWRALIELGWRPQIITGTSVGSLNGAMFALDLYETARDMWLTIRSQDVMELPAEDAPLSELHAFLKDAVTQGGMDVTPLEEIVERVLDEDKLRKSPIRLGLVTVEQKTNKHYYTILKAFGIRNRAPVEKEAEMMDRWLNTYGFTIDLITEACQRTVSKIGQPSFQYAEGILSKWKEQGVRSMADVEQRDAEHQKRKKTASDQNAARKTAPAASSNRFNNFHQREYDYQKLEEQLLK